MKHDFRFISPKNHGIFNYVISFLLVVIPYYGGFEKSIGVWLTLSIAILLFIFTSFTKAPSELWGKLPFSFHKYYDSIFGFGLILVSYLLIENLVLNNMLYFFGVFLIVESIFTRKLKK